MIWGQAPVYNICMTSLKIATYNINSLRSRLPIVLKWLAQEKPDVLALQETKVSDELFPKEAFTKAGWSVAFKGQKGHHGVAIVSKKPLQKVQTTLYPDAKEAEARFILGIYEGIPIFNTYIPQGFEIDSPKYKIKLKFFSDLKKYFSRHLKPTQPALWLGDLNVAQTEIDLARPSGNRDHVCFHIDARNALAKAMEGLWVDLFREKEKGPGHYTFWSMRFGPSTFKNNVGWRVDMILGTPPMVKRLKRIWIDKKPRSLPGSSDHTFVAAEFGDGVNLIT
jgi:exodeoxyribonuclease III